MTSGQFHSLSLSSITVNREERQRRELLDIHILSDSISRLGLIHPVVVTREGVLVAGERRLEACKALGWDSITVQYLDELDPPHIRAIELEENVKRAALPWQDECRAIYEYHELRRAEKSDWSTEDTGEALGISQQTSADKIRVAKELIAGNTRIIEAPKYSTASGIVARTNERKDAQALEALRKVAAVPGAPITEERSPSLINADFTQWAPSYDGPRFNLIHCDFPYGIGADSFNQGSAPSHGGYDDTPDTYWSLLSCLASNLDRLCTESCHLVFWYSLKYHCETLSFLRDNTDFVVDPFPFIWMKSDNIGILPDPQRGPRRIYETALFASRGDRKIISAVSNAYAAPTVRDKHMSEKPEPVLRHFFRMLVDNNTLMLDPTAGSGSALRAAEALGAKYVFGLERDKEFFDRAVSALNQSRRMKDGKTS